MILNYILITFRNLIKYPSFSLIKIIGLGIALASTFSILIYITYHLNYDGYHENKKCIYRVQFESEVRKNGINTPYKLGPTITKEIPSVKDFVRIYKPRKSPLYIQYNNKNLKEDRYCFADNSLFRVFTLPIKIGNKKKLIENSNSIVINNKVARKYFGDDDPVGKVIKANIKSNWYTLKITGVIYEVPSNSEFDLDIILPISLMYKSYEGLFSFYDKMRINPLDSWQMFSVVTYLLLDDPNIGAALSHRLKGIVKKYITTRSKINKIELIPLSKSHIQSPLKSPKKNIYIFTFLGLLILVVASINHIILSISQTMKRINGIAVRKVIGATKKDLSIQIIGDSVVIALLSLPIGLVILELLMPIIKYVTDIKLNNYYYNTWGMIIIILFIDVFVGGLTGLYISIYINKMLPIDIFRMDFLKHRTGVVYRRILMVVQNSIFIGLIACSLIVFDQNRFINHMKLGYNEDNIILIDLMSVKNKQKYELFVSELKRRMPEIEITGSSFIPAPNSSMMIDVFKTENKAVKYQYAYVDYDYFEVLGINLIDGRYFSRNYPSDLNNNVIINRKAVTAFNLSSKIGNTFELNGIRKGKVNVIGKVNNTISTMYNENQPIVYYLNPLGVQYVIIRIGENNASNEINKISKQWYRVFPNAPFSYTYVNDEIDKFYISEVRFEKVIGLFTLLSISIAILGMIGGSAYIIGRRIKEICIRKIIGASVVSVSFMLLKEYVLLLAVSSIIVWPIAYYLINKWISIFAYRIEISAIYFIISTIAALIIIVLCVGTQIVKVALSSPAKYLKYE